MEIVADARILLVEKSVLTLEERRARRALKREKERATSVLRAAKMHAARLVWEKEHPPTLTPSTAPESTATPLSFHVGCSGWFYWHWRGGFYPSEMPTKDWFPHYARTFRTVELNAPFYSWPTVATVESWRRQASSSGFVYTVKASELITHIKRFSRTAELVRDFGHIADRLGPHMGCILFQLPPSFHYSKARLDRILTQLEKHRRNVVEFRHRSWWNDRVYDAFRKNGTIFCSCSGPRLPDELITTADDIYLRFHGTARWYRHDYAEAELAVWVDRVKVSGARNIWAYFNNDRDGHAIRNAQLFLRMLRKSGG